MLGGVFEGSNQPDFSEKDTLFMVQKVPGRLKAVVRSWSDKKYRYFRYFGAKNTYCNVAEVEFYECNDTSALIITMFLMAKLRLLSTIPDRPVVGAG